METKEFEKKLNDLLENRSEKAHKVMTNQFRNFFNDVMKLYAEYKK